MLRVISRYKTTVVGFLTLVLPLVMLWYHARPRPEATIYEKALIRFTSPAQDVMNTVISAVAQVWTDYVWLVDAQKEILQVRRKNQQLAGLVQDREQLRKENARLKSLLKYKGERPELVTVAARVVAKDVSPYHRVLKVRISAGEDHGVRRYQAVITPAGVVGHVDATVGRYAEVKLAVDTGSRISVNVQDREVKGVVAGAGDRNTYDASFMTSDPERKIRPGDMVVTNGEDERFPKGLVVGYITDAKPRHEEGGLRYIVAPSVNYSDLEFVLVVTSQVETPPTMELPRR